ncbi:MAG: glycosyltransferase [Acidobacteria bacterium]|nr:glycosyltransferase [Acidobacteriota bacterium]MCW5970600.1 glycosyltransferase [Blastocatellales bacterium]
MKQKDQHNPSGNRLAARFRAAFDYLRARPYQAFRRFLRGLIPLAHRRRVVRFFRRQIRRGWSGSAESRAASLAALASLLERSAPQRYDIVCFPIINWDFRFQRPQQLMSQLAAAGHRVFYISQEFLDHGPPYELREKRVNVYEVLLHGPDRSVYTDTLDAGALDALFYSLDALRRNLSLGATVAFVQLPFWSSLALRARAEFGWPVVYDCMDYHAGFSTNDPGMLREEGDLIAAADLAIVSSRFLEREVGKRARRSLLVRNGCDAEHFAQVAARPASDRPVIGYYGAIAEWFDSDLVADLAQRRPDWSFLLVGSTFSADLSRLGRLPNVQLPGEQPYADLPQWIDRMDVLLLPFKRTPLTEATNPVKAYEIFAAGKPLVSAPLPEMLEMSPPAQTADGVEAFEREIEAALAENHTKMSEARRAFAREHTWERRVALLEPAVRETFPLVSIVVVTCSDLELNRVCLQSLLTNTEWPDFELVIVDNASADGTRKYLSDLAARHENIRLVFNDADRGVAAAHRLGLAEARGDYIVFLNNEAAVVRGWLTALVRHLAKDSSIGMVAPATSEPGKGTEMFCIAMRREVCDRVGLPGERFGIGMFEE